MEYDELLTKYYMLLKENEQLKQRLECYEPLAPAKDDTPLTNPASTEKQSKIDNHSSSQEKITFFCSLFRGRQDVYAKRWFSVKTKKAGYQPVCENEWNSQFCNKKIYKCSACPNRKLLPLNDTALEHHLRGTDEYGRDVLGIYPLLVDETCYFLAVDFDGNDFEQDVTAFRNACDEKNVSVAIERSRSGVGAHAWIFFTESITAETARKLGSGLLTYAMSKRSELQFTSYDRLFPNQDTMPSGGFGNLIALPLQGRARKNNNSVFVDKNFTPYLDQWALLFSIQKMTPIEVEQVAKNLCTQGDLGVLVKTVDSDIETKSTPWEKLPAQPQLNNTDFLAKITITRANMLYVPKKNISHTALNAIKRLGAFKNPEFYKAQAMRLPAYDKPRIISICIETDEFIGLPRGVEHKLIALLHTANAEFYIEDKTNCGNPIKVTFDGTLRDEQENAAQKMLQHNTGVLSAPTAFGKTVIAAYIIANRETNTLILVHTQTLLSQWKKSLEQFLIIDHELPEVPKKKGRKHIQSLIGQLGAGKNTLNGIVDIALMQSLVSGDEVKEIVRNYGQIIIDECHHVSAVNFEKIVRYANATYIFGLTATPIRQDGHHPIVFMQCGDIRYAVDVKTHAENRPFEHFIIPRFTPVKYLSNNKLIMSKLYSALTQNELRNKLIVSDVLEAIAQNRNPIILTERTEHVKILSEMLTNKGENIITLIGGMSAKEKKAAQEKLESLTPTSTFVILATGKYVGEGFDFPRLDTLFLALPVAWRGTIAQYAGRMHRMYNGKTDVLIYDYIDIHVPVLDRMYHKRIKGYSAIGYKTKSKELQAEKSNSIYDGKNFLAIWNSDISNAQKDILMYSPYIRKIRLDYLMRVFTSAIINGVSITVVTRPPEDFSEKDRENTVACIELLKSAQITVLTRKNIHQRCTIIDQKIVWYGSVNPLGFSSVRDNLMRLESVEVANELL